MKIHRGFTPEQRFWYYAKKTTNGCWLWQGALSGRDNRGYLRVEGVATLASRFSYELHKGEIPNGMYVLHKCDNPQCVNPKHLFLGSQSDNMKDAFQKGRKTTRGAKNPRCILTEDQVREIRRRYPNESGVALAEEFGIDRTQPFRIYSRITWAWLP